MIPPPRALPPATILRVDMRASDLADIRAMLSEYASHLSTIDVKHAPNAQQIVSEWAARAIVLRELLRPR